MFVRRSCHSVQFPHHSHLPPSHQSASMRGFFFLKNISLCTVVYSTVTDLTLYHLPVPTPPGFSTIGVAPSLPNPQPPQVAWFLLNTSSHVFVTFGFGYLLFSPFCFRACRIYSKKWSQMEVKWKLSFF